MKTRAHIIWPAAIIGLLLLSVLTTFAVLIASRSDGGAQVVVDYYRRSVSWDSLASVHQASARLGWTVRIESGGATHPGTAVASFSDSTGAAITGLRGSVTVSRPQLTVILGTHSLTADEATPGRYQFPFPYAKQGLWDLDVVAQRDDQHFVNRFRIEI